jgi:hypothetical protein
MGSFFSKKSNTIKNSLGSMTHKNNNPIIFEKVTPQSKLEFMCKNANREDPTPEQEEKCKDIWNKRGGKKTKRKKSKSKKVKTIHKK